MHSETETFASSAQIHYSLNAASIRIRLWLNLAFVQVVLTLFGSFQPWSSDQSEDYLQEFFVLFPISHWRPLHHLVLDGRVAAQGFVSRVRADLGCLREI